MQLCEWQLFHSLAPPPTTYTKDTYTTITEREAKSHKKFIKSGERFKQQFLFRSIGFSSLTMSHPFNQINVNPFNQLIEQLMINGHRLENNCRFVDVFWEGFRNSVFPKFWNFTTRIRDLLICQCHGCIDEALNLM